MASKPGILSQKREDIRWNDVGDEPPPTAQAGKGTSISTVSLIASIILFHPTMKVMRWLSGIRKSMPLMSTLRADVGPSPLAWA